MLALLARTQIYTGTRNAANVHLNLLLRSMLHHNGMQVSIDTGICKLKYWGIDISMYTGP